MTVSKQTKLKTLTWKNTEISAMLYPKISMEKSPSAAMTTPAAVNITERVTCNMTKG